mmetsp:Transcript_34053/g.58231  ORF Transcript_34053/g.58231 Transcript_34053/m.58231 type:complete len:346 (+) Transcript_34053:323-1360(+)
MATLATSTVLCALHPRHEPRSQTRWQHGGSCAVRAHERASGRCERATRRCASEDSRRRGHAQCGRRTVSLGLAKGLLLRGRARCLNEGGGAARDAGALVLAEQDRQEELEHPNVVHDLDGVVEDGRGVKGQRGQSVHYARRELRELHRRHRLLQWRGRADVHRGKPVVAVHDHVDARVDPRAVRVSGRATLGGGGPSVMHPAPHDHDRRVVPQVQERQLLVLLPQGDDDRVDAVQVLAQVVQVDAVPHVLGLRLANAPDAAAQRVGDEVRHVPIDHALGHVVEHKDRLWDADGGTRLHELVEPPDASEVEKAGWQRHRRQVVLQRQQRRLHEQRHPGRTGGVQST